MSSHYVRVRTSVRVESIGIDRGSSRAGVRTSNVVTAPGIPAYAPESRDLLNKWAAPSRSRSRHRLRY